MKIIRLTTLLDYGGQEQQYISFVKKKELLENEYLFASIGHGGYAEEAISRSGFKVKVFNLAVSQKNIFNIFKIANWLKQERPDIVHTAAAEANFHGVLAAKIAGVPIIIGEEIGIPNHSKRAKLIYKFVYSFCNIVIGVSDSVCNALIELKEVPEEKVRTVYNPVSLPKKIIKQSSSEFQWVYVGRLSAIKNVKTLILAFLSLDKEKRGNLHIIGDGDERISLENLASGNSDIIFHGFQDEPEKIVSQSDVFILPSYSEGFGIAVVEAMFQKVPCLCSNVGGIPEFISDNQNGWLFNPYNQQELTNKMKYLLSVESNELNLMGESAYKSVILKFSTENYITTIENLYEKFKKE